jgi:chitin synthase
MSHINPARSTSLRRNISTSSQTGIDSNKPRRQRSLVRPERERNDPNNRLYHYRLRAANGQNESNHLAPSRTGNQPAPLASQETFKPLERRPTAREQLLRRGRSILGREEKHDDDEPRGAIEYDDPQRKRGCCAGFSPWMAYCRIITCCIPKPLLRCAGKKSTYRTCLVQLITGIRYS